MSLEEGLDKLVFQLRLITGVADVQFERSDHEIEMLIVLKEYDLDVREFALELVDDYARYHVDEATVVAHFVDAATAELSLAGS